MVFTVPQLSQTELHAALRVGVVWIWGCGVGCGMWVCCEVWRCGGMVWYVGVLCGEGCGFIVFVGMFGVWVMTNICVEWGVRVCSMLVEWCAGCVIRINRTFTAIIYFNRIQIIQQSS